MNVEKVESLKREILGEVEFDDFYYDIYEDNDKKEYNLLFLKNDNLVTLYQGRVYCESLYTAFDDDGEFKYHRLLEFISEPYQLYFENKAELQKRCPKIYHYIEEVIT